LAVVLAGAVASVGARGEAAWLTAGVAMPVTEGWTRIAGRYESEAGEPVFRAIGRCGDGEAAAHVLDGRVHLAPAGGHVWLDLPDRLVPARAPCEAPVLSIEMLVDGTVVASAPVARRERTASGLSAAIRRAPPSPAVRPAGRVSLKAQKYGAPIGKRTEAGVELALDSRVSIQLNYERTTQAPMMPFDHDDGILTRLRVGF
jgi:hypothetical protein